MDGHESNQRKRKREEYDLKKSARLKIKGAQCKMISESGFAAAVKEILEICKRLAQSGICEDWAKVFLEELRNFVILDELYIGIEKGYCCPESARHVLDLLLHFAHFDARENHKLKTHALIENQMKSITIIFYLMLGYPTQQDLGIQVLRKLCQCDNGRMLLPMVNQLGSAQYETIATGVGLCILKWMRENSMNATFQKRALFVLSYLFTSSEIQWRMVPNGAVERIVTAMRNHKADLKVQENACCALLYLAEHPNNKGELVRSQAGKHILDAMQTHLQEPGIQMKGCAGISRIFNMSDGEEDLLSLEAGERVLEVIKTHKEKEAVLEQAFRALISLSKTCHIKVKLVEKGVVGLLLEVMETLGAIQTLGKLLLTGEKGVIILSQPAGDRILKDMARQKGSSAVQTLACNILTVLAADHRNKKELNRLGAESVIRESMQIHSAYPMLHDAALKAINCLADNEEDIVNSLHTADSERVLHLMKIHLNSAAIQVEGCSALGILPLNKQSAAEQMNKVAFECISQAMQIHERESKVLEKACEALHNLLSKIRLEEPLCKEVGKSLLNAMGAHPGCIAIQVKACAALYFVAYDERKQVELTRLGAEDRILHAMKQDWTNETLQEKGCRILFQLCGNNERSSTPAVSQNIGECILRAMKSFIGNELIQEYGCGALYNLSSTRETLDDLISLKAYRQVLKALATHKGNKIVQENGCASLVSFARRCPTVLINKFRAEKYILEAMKNHKSNHEIQESACHALCLLAETDESKIKLFESGAGNHILEAMQEHNMKPGVQKRACEAISRLALNKENKTKLNEIRAGEIIVKSMKNFDASSSSQRKALNALQNLTDGFESIAVQLMKLGAGKLVLNVMEKHRNKVAVQIDACAFILGTAESSESRIALLELGAGKLILEAMERYKANCTLQQKALAALQRLAYSCLSPAGNVLDLGAVKCILEAMETHRGSAEVQVEACGIIWNLAISDEAQVDLLKIGAAEQIMEAIKAHKGNADVQLEACGALCSLSENNANKTALKNMDLEAVITETMEACDGHTIFQERACGLLQLVYRKRYHRRNTTDLLVEG